MIQNKLRNWILILLTLTVMIPVSCDEPPNSKNNISENISILKDKFNNYPEIMDVLLHYESLNDTLKLKACIYLIKNIIGHYSYNSQTLEQYDKIFDIINENPSRFIGNYDIPETNKVWDSLRDQHGSFPKSPEKVMDIDEITSEILIENIEYAFKAWEFQWSKDLSFEHFCKYVLPYRFENEYMESWRKKYFEKFQWLQDSMKASSDRIKAATYINENIKNWFRFNNLFNKYPSPISPNNLLSSKMGKCLDQAAIVNFAMRSIGLPVTHEVIPQWGNRSMGHDFSSILTQENKYIDFLGGELNPYYNELRGKAPKIYRSHYDIQNNSILNYKGKLSNIPDLFLNLFLSDVTSNYVKTASPSIYLTETPPPETEYVYLSVFNNKNWIPIALSKFSTIPIFKDMGLDIIYLPVYYQNNEVLPAGYPFLLDKKNNIKYFVPDKKNRITIKVKRKYPLDNLKKTWLTWMEGGKFQGSNDKSFTKFDNLFTIENDLEMKYYVHPVKSTKKYKYLRYKFPKGKWGSYAEIAFYEELGGNIKRISGIPIKSSRVSEEHMEFAFDGKFDRFSHALDREFYDDEWVGLELSSPVMISHIGFSPRNDRNSIIKGMVYQLKYWDNGWINVGMKYATKDDVLEFSNVPKNSLLLLSNTLEGTEERIFYYNENDSTQYFY